MHLHPDTQGWPTPSTRPAEGMLAEVVKLRDHGRRISRQQMEETKPILGLFKVTDHSPSPGVIRHRRAATLDNPQGLGSVSVPLFEPVLEKWEKGGVVISGYEINPEGKVPVQHVQVWLVRPVRGEAISID